MITEAIILAGGLGTRLRSAVPDLPKCMAPVAGRPFLSHLIDYLSEHGIRRFVLALGYKSEVIIDHINREFSNLDCQFSIETEPLGTGGAIKLACESSITDEVLVVNGDTMFKIDLSRLSAFHETAKADCTLVLKPMENFDRYGVVSTNDRNEVTAFKEKSFYKEGNINGGVYALSRLAFLEEQFPRKFSFERDYLEAFAGQRKFFGIKDEGYFIDIGIPTDYERAQNELAG